MTSIPPSPLTPRPAQAPADAASPVDPDADADAGDGGTSRLSLSRLLARAVLGAKAQQLGRPHDVIVRLRGAQYPLVTGLVAELGGRRLFVPAELVTDWDSDHLALASARLDLREFERRDGEVLLRTDILGHRLIDIPAARLVRAYDLELAATDTGWVLAGVDTRPRSWWRRALARLRRPTDHHDYDLEGVGGCRDWKAFEALIGHAPSALTRSPTARLRRLKAPQIADLLEDASRAEQHELLDHVHTDPELEADVFEELDEGEQSRLLRDRTDPDIAAVLARMRADDAADAVMDLPQHRRAPVLELLPAGQATKVRTLLGFNPTSAGGLMGLDFVALAHTGTTAQALDRVRTANTLQPEALTTVFSLDHHQRLRGAASLVALLQAHPDTTLGEVAEPDPVRVGPDTDLPDVAVLMCDYNLLNLPVVDHDDHVIGVITVDDALEATVPDQWRRREPQPHDTDPPDSENAGPENAGPDRHGTGGAFTARLPRR